ncbi:hypothetical protein ACFX2I_043354 [Malus domestica]
MIPNENREEGEDQIMVEWGQQCLQVQLCTWHVVESLGQVGWKISASNQPTAALENMVLLELVRPEHAGGERERVVPVRNVWMRWRTRRPCMCMSWWMRW